MNTKKMKSSKIIGILVLFLFGTYAAYSEYRPTTEGQAGEDYEKGSIIVKFKEPSRPISTQSVRPPQKFSKQQLGLSQVKSMKKFFRTGSKELDSGSGFFHTQGVKPNRVSRKKRKRFKKMSDLREKYGLDRVFKVEIDPSENVEDVLRALRSNPNVEYAHPNYLYQTQAVPNDPFYETSGSWGLPYDDLWSLKPDRTNTEQAWDLEEGDDIVVAVVDTGVDGTHPDLERNMWTNEDEIPNDGIDNDGNGFIDDVKGWDFANDDNDPSDDRYHGTHVAGTIAAMGDNAEGIIGVSPKVKIMPVKGLGLRGGTVEDLANSLEYAVMNGARVINNSWGPNGRRPSQPTFETVIKMAYEMGVVVVFSAGNSNDNVAYYSPANMRETIAVAATDAFDQRAEFSNFGLGVDVAAPGVQILSTFPVEAESAPRKIMGTVMTDTNRRLATRPVRFTGLLPDDGIESSVLFAGQGLAEDFEGQDFSGKIALLFSEDDNISTLYNNARQAGAVAVIFQSKKEKGINRWLALPEAEPIPAFTVSKEDGLYLKDQIEGGATELSLAYVDLGAYGVIDGTSMSAPHVSGLAALLLSKNPNYTYEEVRSLIRQGVDSISPDRFVGNGRMNSYKALLLETVPPVAKLEVPDLLRGTVEINGVATGENPISYTVSVGSGIEPTRWHEIHSDNGPVSGGVLVESFDTSIFSDGIHTVRLRVTDGFNLTNEDYSLVTIRNFEITYPFNNDIFGVGTRIDVKGTVQGQFDHYEIEHGIGIEPTLWTTDGVTLVNGGRQPVLEDTLATIQTQNFAADEFHRVRVTLVKLDEMPVESEFIFYLDSMLKPGWPQYVEQNGLGLSWDWQDPVVVDLNKDGIKEIVTVDQGTTGSEAVPTQLVVYNFDGTVQWKNQLSSEYTYDNIPTIGDLDGDGFMEILVDGQNNIFGEPVTIFGFKHDGSALSENWPVVMEQAEAGYSLTKLIVDLDNDGKKEIISLSDFPPEFPEWKTNKLTLINAEGEMRFIADVNYCGTRISRVQMPAVGNFDDDLDLEMVVRNGCSSVEIINRDGTRVLDYPIHARGTIYSSLLAGDVNNDGQDEIIVAVSNGFTNFQESGVYVYDRFGELLPGWPIERSIGFGAGLSLADFDGDGDLEISVTDTFRETIEIFHHSGELAVGWPQSTSGFGLAQYLDNTSIGDINGDGKPDVVIRIGGIGTDVIQENDFLKLGGVFAWNFDGSRIDLNPNPSINTLVVGSGWEVGFFSGNPPIVITDIEGNGKVDIVAATYNDKAHGFDPELGVYGGRSKKRNSIFAWELDSPYLEETMHWPMLHRDTENTGHYRDPASTLTLPHLTAQFDLPESLQGQIDIFGSAMGDNFKEYVLSYRLDDRRSGWIEIHRSVNPVIEGVLLSDFDTTVLPKGPISFRLVAFNQDNQTSVYQVATEIRNIEISSPLNNDIYRRGDQIEIRGLIGPSFQNYRIEIGEGKNPTAWTSEGITLRHSGPGENVEGILATWDTGATPMNGFYRMRISVNLDLGIRTFDVHMVYLDDNLKPGWPQTIEYPEDFFSSSNLDVKIVDLDQDGKKEIITMKRGWSSSGEEGNKLIVFRSNGQIWWSQKLKGNLIGYPLPVIGDIDHDGFHEILIADAGSDGIARSEIRAFDYKGMEILSGWPLSIDHQFSALLMADVDRNGTNELIIRTRFSGGSNDKVYVVSGEGEIESEFELDPQFSLCRGPQLPALGNFDNDLDLEIVVKSDVGQLSVFNFDGTELPGWPQDTGGDICLSSIVTGDIDQDGLDNIVIGVEQAYQSTEDPNLRVYDESGDMLPGWPFVYEDPDRFFRGEPAVIGSWTGPALADLDQDGDLEISVVAGQYIFVLDKSAQLFPGWPKRPLPTYFESGPTIGDINGDGNLDVVLAIEGLNGNIFIENEELEIGGVYAWNFDGTQIDLDPSSPRKNLFMENEAAAWVAIDDIDGDGRTDLVTASHRNQSLIPNEESGFLERFEEKNRGSVYAWNLRTSYDEAKMPWPTVQRDIQNTGRYQPFNAAPEVDAGPNVEIPFQERVNLSGVVTDDQYPTGRILTVFWSKVSGPGPIEFEPSNGVVNPTVRFSEPGVYILKLLATDGNKSNSDTISLSLLAPQQAPATVHRNKFNPAKGESGEIGFVVPQDSSVEINLYDRFGYKVKQLVNTVLSANSYVQPWDGRGDDGDIVPSGVYNVIMKIGDQEQVIKMVVSK